MPRRRGISTSGGSSTRAAKKKASPGVGPDDAEVVVVIELEVRNDDLVPDRIHALGLAESLAVHRAAVLEGSDKLGALAHAGCCFEEGDAAVEHCVTQPGRFLSGERLHRRDILPGRADAFCCCNQTLWLDREIQQQTRPDKGAAR